MKVSVIIPAYNAKATIDETLSSLDAQTFCDFEVVVVDDGSQDGTADYVREHYPDVRVFSQANAGPAAARNYGVSQSQGEWLAFLDADDAWLSWRLQLQLDLVDTYPEVQMFCGHTTDLVTAIEDPTLTQRGQSDFVQLLNVRDFAFSNPVATTTVLLRRSLFTSLDGFDEQFRGPEDYDLWMRVAMFTPIVEVMYPVSRYRDEVGSLSRNYETFLPQVLRVLDKAFSPGGALCEFNCKGKAQAVQYFGASWMASETGARVMSVSLMLQSFCSYPWALRMPGKKPYQRVVMLLKSLRGLIS